MFCPFSAIIKELFLEDVFFVTYLPDDGRKRPKHLGGLHMIYTSNYCAVVGINILKGFDLLS
jgi:hypothetical protein